MHVRLLGSCHKRGRRMPLLDTPNGRAAIEALFGTPGNKDGTLDEAWEGANIRKVAPPDGWQLFYQSDNSGLVRISGIRMHRLLEDSFHNVLAEIWQHAAEDIGGDPTAEAIRAWLHERRLDQHGGGFN